MNYTHVAVSIIGTAAVGCMGVALAKGFPLGKALSVGFAVACAGVLAYITWMILREMFGSRK